MSDCRYATSYVIFLMLCSTHPTSSIRIYHIFRFQFNICSRTIIIFQKKIVCCVAQSHSMQCVERSFPCFHLTEERLRSARFYFICYNISYYDLCIGTLIVLLRLSCIESKCLLPFILRFQLIAGCQTRFRIERKDVTQNAAQSIWKSFFRLWPSFTPCRSEH